MTDELRERVDELEQRVAELENKLKSGADSHDSQLLDRYDTYVVESVKDGQRPKALKLRRLYEEAGVRDKKKIKQRVKRLDRLGVWEGEK